MQKASRGVVQRIKLLAAAEAKKVPARDAETLR